MTNVRVVIRFRPVNDVERESPFAEDDLLVEYQNGNQTVHLVTKDHTKDYSFNFDYVFCPTTLQDDFYSICCKPVMDDVLKGFNGTIFAFGQTGSGKTWSMMGPNYEERIQKPHLRGLVPRACEAIFDYIAHGDSNTEFKLSVSYLEIYREEVQDLIDVRNKKLRIHESPGRGIFVAGLTECYIGEIGDVYRYLKLGDHNKVMASTKMNARSSRSHSVFALRVDQTDVSNGRTTHAKINLVDLAGSEKVQKTGAAGTRLEEAKKINQSLSALGHCINCIVKRRRHIPYRDSKLTRILQESLGGNSKTTVICACSPHRYNLEETVATLRFGVRAKSIKLRAKANVMLSAAQLSKMVDQLKRLLKCERLKNKVLLTELGKLRPLSQGEQKELDGLKRIRGTVTMGETPEDATPSGESTDLEEGEDEGEVEEDEVASEREEEPEQEGEIHRDPDGLLADDCLESMTLHQLHLEMSSLKCKYHTDIDCLKDEISNKRVEVEERVHTIEELQGKMTELKGRSEEFQERADEAIEERDEIAHKHAFELKQVEMEKSVFQREAEELQRKYEALEQQKNELEEQALSSVTIDDPTQRGEYLAQLETMRRDTESLQEDAERLSAQVAELEAKNQSLHSAEIASSQKIEELVDRNAELSDELHAAKKRTGMVEAQLIETEQDLEELLSVNEEVEGDVAKNEVKIAEMQVTGQKKDILLKKMKILMDDTGVDVRRVREISLQRLMAAHTDGTFSSGPPSGVDDSHAELSTKDIFDTVVNAAPIIDQLVDFETREFESLHDAVLRGEEVDLETFIPEAHPDAPPTQTTAKDQIPQVSGPAALWNALKNTVTKMVIDADGQVSRQQVSQDDYLRLRSLQVVSDMRKSDPSSGGEDDPLVLDVLRKRSELLNINPSECRVEVLGKVVYDGPAESDGSGSMRQATVASIRQSSRLGTLRSLEFGSIRGTVHNALADQISSGSLRMPAPSSPRVTIETSRIFKEDGTEKIVEVQVMDLAHAERAKFRDVVTNLKGDVKMLSSKIAVLQRQQKAAEDAHQAELHALERRVRKRLARKAERVNSELERSKTEITELTSRLEHQKTTTAALQTNMKERVAHLESTVTEMTVAREKLIQQSFDGASASARRSTGPNLKNFVNELFSTRVKYERAAAERERLRRDYNHVVRQSSSDRKKLRIETSRTRLQGSRITELEQEMLRIREQAERRNAERQRSKKQREDLRAKIKELSQQLSGKRRECDALRRGRGRRGRRGRGRGRRGGRPPPGHPSHRQTDDLSQRGAVVVGALSGMNMRGSARPIIGGGGVVTALRGGGKKRE